MAEESERQRLDEAMALFREAYEYQMKGDLEEAIQRYQRSIAACPTAEAHTFLGWTFSFQGRWDDAIQECLKAIEVDPTFGNPYNDIGAYLMELNRLEEAVSWFKKALHAPRYDSYCFPHFNLGRVYERQKHFARALKHYRAALAENPQHPGAYQAVRRLQSMMN